VTKIPAVKKQVRRIDDQKENESRRLWKEVTAGLKLNDIEKATTAKTTLEQKQRDEAKIRKEQNVEWPAEVRTFIHIKVKTNLIFGSRIV